MFRRTMAGPALVAVLVAVGLFVVSGTPGLGSPTALAPTPGGPGSSPGGSSPAGSGAINASAQPSSAPGTLQPSATPAPPASPPPGTPGSVGIALAARLQKSLDAFAAAHRLPGTSVTITWADGRSWTGTSGLADVRAARPVTPDTVFAVASMSKTFTAALILGMVDEGRVSLDSKVATILPTVRLGTPGRPIPAGITVRMLLDHTSGLADFFFSKGIDKALLAGRGATWTPAMSLARVGKALGKPGRSWNYSNTNYVLLGLIAEKIGGKPFAKLVRTRLLQPLGLDGIFIQGVERPTGPLALGYYYSHLGPSARPIALADAGRSVVPFTSVVTAAGTAGNVAATSAQLARWARALYGGSVLRAETLAMAVADARVTARFRPYVPYGLGVQVTTIGRHPALGHSGRFIGVRGELRYLTDAGLAIAIVTSQNGADVRPLVAKLVAFALPKPAVPASPVPGVPASPTPAAP
ncbi:MAG: serine hydrolase domain-containing protein [Chloroflexota bacterium]